MRFSISSVHLSARDLLLQDMPLRRDYRASEVEPASPTAEWGAPPQNKEPKRMGFRLLGIAGALLGIVVFVIALGGYYVYRGGQGLAVGIDFVKPERVLQGEPFSVSVSVFNSSERQVRRGRLSLFIPEGIFFAGEPPGQRVQDRETGDIAAASVIQETFTLIAAGGGDMVKRIEAKFTYSIGENENVEFSASDGIDISVGQPAVALTFDAPQSILAGQAFEIRIEYQNNSKQRLQNVRVRLEHPPRFAVSTSAPSSAKDYNEWQMSELESGGRGMITLVGRLTGAEQSFVNFTASISAEISGEEYTLGSQTASIMIAPSPLSLSVTVNDDPNYVARLDDTLHYVVSYRNNSDVTLENAVLRLTIVGKMVSFKDVITEAFVNSLTNTFTWTVANTPSFARIPPGGGGSVKLDLRLTNTFPIQGPDDKNFTVKAHAEMESPTVPAGIASDRTFAATDIETKTAGAVSIDARAFFRDAETGILNAGPYPPVVNMPTQYTIHWVITNYATDIRDVRVSSFLQSGARWTGKVKSTITTLPVYDPETGRVTWNIPFIAAGTGILSAPIEAVFQIEAMPAVNEVGRDVTLLAKTHLEAYDTFVNTTLTSEDEILTTMLPDDKAAAGFERRVRAQ